MKKDGVYSVRVSAETILALRRACGWYHTQTDFGKRFGVTKRTVIRWEQRGTIIYWYDGPKAEAWRELSAKYRDILKPSERQELWRGR